MSVTLHFTSIDSVELRAVLLATYVEFRDHPQPAHVGTSYATEHDAGRVGCIVRVEGGASFTVTTFPLSPDSAARVATAVSQNACWDARNAKQYGHQEAA